MVQIMRYDIGTALNGAAGARTPVCVSFNGGAWRGIFFAGVVEQIQATFDASEIDAWSFCGSSAGACYALALAMGYPAEGVKKLLCEATARARCHTLGVAFRVNDITGQIILDMVATMDEDELLRRLHDRFAICFTAVGCDCVPRAYLAFNFSSKADLFNACKGSANIPLFSSLTDFPRIGGLRSYDGGFTPDGCVPLLRARCNVFTMCFGDAEGRGLSLKKNPLPPGVELDIAEKNPPVPITACYRCPKNDEEVYETAERGRILAAAFFSSDTWLRRYAKAAGFPPLTVANLVARTEAGVGGGEAPVDVRGCEDLGVGGRDGIGAPTE